MIASKQYLNRTLTKEAGNDRWTNWDTLSLVPVLGSVASTKFAIDNAKDMRRSLAQGNWKGAGWDLTKGVGNTAMALADLVGAGTLLKGGVKGIKAIRLASLAAKASKARKAVALARNADKVIDTTKGLRGAYKAKRLAKLKSLDTTYRKGQRYAQALSRSAGIAPDATSVTKAQAAAYNRGLKETANRLASSLGANAHPKALSKIQDSMKYMGNYYWGMGNPIHNPLSISKNFGTFHSALVNTPGLKRVTEKTLVPLTKVPGFRSGYGPAQARGFLGLMAGQYGRDLEHTKALRSVYGPDYDPKNPVVPPNIANSKLQQNLNLLASPEVSYNPNSRSGLFGLSRGNRKAVLADQATRQRAVAEMPGPKDYSKYLNAMYSQNQAGYNAAVRRGYKFPYIAP